MSFPSFTINIGDVRRLRALFTQPVTCLHTTLSTAIDNCELSISVADVTDWPDAGVIKINDLEWAAYSSKSGTTLTIPAGYGRGFGDDPDDPDNATNQDHASGVEVVVYYEFVDPGGVLFKYKPPGGSLTTKTYGTDVDVIREFIGSYYYDLSLTASGKWYYGSFGTSSNEAAEEGVIEVVRTKLT